MFCSLFERGRERERENTQKKKNSRSLSLFSLLHRKKKNTRFKITGVPAGGPRPGKRGKGGRRRCTSGRRKGKKTERKREGERERKMKLRLSFSLQKKKCVKQEKKMKILFPHLFTDSSS